MAWRITREKEITFNDRLGPVGGFLRTAADADRTAIGPIYSPNGTAHWIVVSDAGALSAVTTKP